MASQLHEEHAPGELCVEHHENADHPRTDAQGDPSKSPRGRKVRPAKFSRHGAMQASKTERTRGGRAIGTETRVGSGQ